MATIFVVSSKNDFDLLARRFSRANISLNNVMLAPVVVVIVAFNCSSIIFALDTFDNKFDLLFGFDFLIPPFESSFNSPAITVVVRILVGFTIGLIVNFVIIDAFLYLTTEKFEILILKKSIIKIKNLINYLFNL